MRLIFRNLLVAFLILSPWTPLRGQLRLHSRYILTSAAVARALSTSFSKEHLNAGQPTVLLLADVTATEADPQLDVERPPMQLPGAIIGTDHQIIVQMHCHAAAVCLPFYALVSWSSPPTSAAVKGWDTPGPLPQSFASQVTMHTGAHVVLVLEGVGTRLELPVVTLQSGKEGALIRAVSLDRRHTFMGKVVSAKVLKGNL